MLFSTFAGKDSVSNLIIHDTFNASVHKARLMNHEKREAEVVLSLIAG